MFALIRNLIGRRNRNLTSPSGSLMTTTLSAQPTLPRARAVSSNPTRCPAPAPTAAAASAHSTAANALALPVEGEDVIGVSLSAIIARLPEELRGAVLGAPSAEAVAVLPLSAVIGQLATGSVRFPLGYLRQVSSEPCFAQSPHFDNSIVTLPLEEVLARIAPAQLPRRARQTISIPDSVTAPFGANAPQARLNVPVPEPVTEPTPEPLSVAVEPVVAEPVAAPVPSTAVPKLLSPTAPPIPSAPAPVSAPAIVPAAAHMPAPILPAPASLRLVPAPVPAPAIVPVATQTPAPSLPAPVAPRPVPAPVPKSAPSPAAFAEATPHRETSFLRAGCLALPVTRLANSWPATVLQELANQNLAGETVELPVEEVEAGLKQGRLAFTWRQIRAWMPSVRKPLDESAYDSTALELPLRFVAPLFLSQRPTPVRQRASVADSIPDVFGPGALGAGASALKAEPNAAATGQPPAPVQPAQTRLPEPPVSAPAFEAIAMPTTAATTPAPTSATQSQTSFLTRRTVDEVLQEPGKTSWTPMEIVRKISRLKGVAGATIATQDGLMVAEQYPALVGADTFCALTTQLFNRAYSTAMELRLGGPSRVGFAAEGVTYEIYRCAKLYLMVVSQPGEKLPSHELNIIADHLINQSR